jgi:hypothetical protein
MNDPKRFRKEQEDDVQSSLNVSEDIERGVVDAGESSSEEALGNDRLVHPYITNRHGNEEP